MQITINQHYVPRFYMKFFSNIINANSKREKVLISFYQFKDDLYRKDVPTNSICSEDYFYDKDGSIENALANKEGIWGTALRNANDNTYTLADLENIREFVIYQIIRTKAMLSHNRSMATNMMKCVIKKKFGDVANEDELNEFLSNKIQNEITPELGLSIAQEMIPVISDLKMKIITNETQMRFISSDAPVIIINPLGIYSAGLSFV